MSSTVKDLIEYLGVSDNLPNAPSSFKHLNSHDTLTLSDKDPDINKILRVTADTDVIETRIITTPKATSFAGEISTGWEIIVENQLELKIEYSTGLINRPVHIVCFSIPYSTFIVLPNYFKPSHSVKISSYIENIYTKHLNQRQIFQNTVILLDVFIYGFNRIRFDL